MSDINKWDLIRDWIYGAYVVFGFSFVMGYMLVNGFYVGALLWCMPAIIDLIFY